MRNRRKQVEILRSRKVIGRYVTTSQYLSVARNPQLHEQVDITIDYCLQPIPDPRKAKQASQVAGLPCSERDHVGVQR